MEIIDLDNLCCCNLITDIAALVIWINLGSLRVLIDIRIMKHHSYQSSHIFATLLQAERIIIQIPIKG